MDEPVIRWGHAADREATAWHGAFATREEAIADGRETYGGEPFWVCSGPALVNWELLPSAEELIETMGERAGEEVGEAAEDWPDVSVEARIELDDLLRAWCERHVTSELWIPDGDPERVEGKR